MSSSVHKQSPLEPKNCQQIAGHGCQHIIVYFKRYRQDEAEKGCESHS